MNKLNITRIENSTIFFTYPEISTLTLRLVANGSVEYTTTLAIDPLFEYFIWHPSLLIHEKMILEAWGNGYSEFHRIYDLRKQPEHRLNQQ